MGITCSCMETRSKTIQLMSDSSSTPEIMRRRPSQAEIDSMYGSIGKYQINK